MRKYISHLHYITHDLPGTPHIQQARIACEAGANWVQYRCLTKNDKELLNDIHAIATICDDWGTTLIVTEHVHLHDQADIQGFHLENRHADLQAARKLIGDDKTLGASANSFEDIERQALTGAVDYFGCGPFSLTMTKRNDYPVLGVPGYRPIIEKMRLAQLDIPVLAVGGVTAADIPLLLEAGVYGIAVSGAVNRSADPSASYKELYRLIF